MTTRDKQAVSRQQVTGHSCIKYAAKVEDMGEDMVYPMFMPF